VPSLSPLHITALRAAEDVVIPLAPTYYDQWVLKELITSIVRVRRDNPALTVTGVVLNKVDTRTTLNQEIQADLTHDDFRVRPDP
jgi:cellulose biosynthesis protein BcsQ